MEIILNTEKKHMNVINVKKLKFRHMLSALKSSIRKGDDLSKWTVGIPLVVLLELLESTNVKEFKVNINRRNA